MRLRITYREDGREDRDVTVSASARLLWEKEHGALLNAMASGRSEWAETLAYTTLHRGGEIPEKTELLDWLDTVESVQWAMPANKLVALAVTLGVIAPPDVDGLAAHLDAEVAAYIDRVAGDVPDPTQEPEAPSPVNSRNSRSKPAKVSTS